MHPRYLLFAASYESGVGCCLGHPLVSADPFNVVPDNVVFSPWTPMPHLAHQCTLMQDPEVPELRKLLNTAKRDGDCGKKARRP
jgi:hypothetical protein